MSKLRDLIDQSSGIAEGFFTEFSRLGPGYVIEQGDGNKEYVAIDCDESDKFLATAAMREYLADVRAVRCVFMAEAWSLQTRRRVEEIQDWMAEHGTLENHPQRIEVIVFSGEDEDGTHIQARRVIHRPRGAAPYLDPLEIMPTAIRAEGNMVGMLPRKGKSQ